ncbi:MAG: sigma-54-dependent Fis family transcriptional regulator [Piscirickettsiaceae bacterium]|nr:sigma-54-dependent Fis family transcriptional regulator [Piscirickettsiaceae bacterium]
MSEIIKHNGKEAFSILIVDDELGIQDFLQRSLRKIYTLVEVAGTAEEADVLRMECSFDLLIIDISLPGMSGVEWWKSIANQIEHSDVIFMTAFADIDNTIEALRIGAFDFIQKPFRLEEIILAVERCFERRSLERENFVLRRQVDRLYLFEGMIGTSPQVQDMCKLISRIAATPSVILIEGESGTGKELVANAIHKESKRSGPFVPINCGAISPELIESEFFGHKKGAFTGAEYAHKGLFSYADGGTLFLDEVGEMPLSTQAKFLRVLEEGRIRPVGSEREIVVDVRVVAATNRNLKEDVQNGLFREDLFYRLNVLTIHVAPLRERKQDIAPIVQYYSKLLATQLSLPPVPFNHNDIQQLAAYDWPGNIRELKNMIERCILLGKLPDEMLIANTGRSEKTVGYPDSWTVDEVEKAHIVKAVDNAGGNKTQASKVLGISRKTLCRKLQAMVDNHADD